MTEFNECIEMAFDGNTWYISCRLGLWSVQSECKDTAKDEAFNYFRQYKEDGEYYKIIGGQSPSQKLIRKNLGIE